jgi:hypothetical protein
MNRFESIRLITNGMVLTFQEIGFRAIQKLIIIKIVDENGINNLYYETVSDSI